MRTLILAAGRGSRMGNATDKSPKCLTRLQDRTLLEWQVSAFKQAGISELAIVTGYEADQLNNLGYPAFHNANWARTNMVMSLMAADEWLRVEPCLISYADIVYHPDHLDRLQKAKSDISITYDISWNALWSLRFKNPLEDAETFLADASGKLMTIGGKPHCIDEIQGQYMGLLKLTPSGWKRISRYVLSLSEARQETLDMTSLLSLLIEAGELIEAVPVKGRWCEVDSQSDVSVIERALNAGPGWSHDWRFEIASPVPVLKKH